MEILKKSKLRDLVRMARIKGEYVVAVFLDIEKAYDMVWTHGLLQELYNIE